MDQRAEHRPTVTIDSKSCDVLSRLQRPGISSPAFTPKQLEELRSNHRIKTDSYASGYSYTTALNHIAKGKPGIGHKDGTKSLSLMIWDLLQTDELADDLLLLATATQLHQRTGGLKREARVSNPMGSWIIENSSLLEGAVEFLTDSAELNSMGASSKSSIAVRYSCCGAEDATTCMRFTEKIKSHSKYETAVKCADCARSFVPLGSYFETNSQILDDSGIRTDRVSADQLQLPSGSTEEIEIFFGCHEGYATLSAESLKNKIMRARQQNHSQISCNDCSVTQGKIEGKIVSFIEGNIATMEFLGMPTAVLTPQFRFSGIENMPYDLLVSSPDGNRTLIEVDGGFHYENRNSEAFEKKVEADRVKTERALAEGYNLIRIDERNLNRLNGKIRRVLLEAVTGSVARYSVIGKECPGAVLASAAYRD